MADSFHVIEPQTVKLNEGLSYIDQPIVIVVSQIKKLWSKEIVLIKVQ